MNFSFKKIRIILSIFTGQLSSIWNIFIRTFNNMTIPLLPCIPMYRGATRTFARGRELRPWVRLVKTLSGPSAAARLNINCETFFLFWYYWVCISEVFIFRSLSRQEFVFSGVCLSGVCLSGVCHGARESLNYSKH